MCGIVGYVGPREAIDYLLSGLRRLEYRGYDSSGIALVTPERHLTLCKSAGRIDRLEAGLPDRLRRAGRASGTPAGPRTAHRTTSTPTRTWAATARLPSFTTGSSRISSRSSAA